MVKKASVEYNIRKYVATDNISASINNRQIKLKREDRILLSRFEAEVLKLYVIQLNEGEN